MPTLTVKVVPGSSRTRISGRYGDGLKIQVSAVPEKGKANAAVIELLANKLGLPASSFTVISGQTRPRKLIKVEGIEIEEMTKKIKKILGE
jgi:uncharacterized protein